MVYDMDRFHADKALAVQFPAKNGDKNAAANEEPGGEKYHL